MSTVQFQNHVFDNTYYQFTAFQLERLLEIEKREAFVSWTAGPFNHESGDDRIDFPRGPRRPGKYNFLYHAKNPDGSSNDVLVLEQLGARKFMRSVVAPSGVDESAVFEAMGIDKLCAN